MIHIPGENIFYLETFISKLLFYFVENSNGQRYLTVIIYDRKQQPAG
jgi:hypothetical protein